MHAFSEVLTAPPCVEILHVDDGKAGLWLRPDRRRGGPDLRLSATDIADAGSCRLSGT